MCGIIGAINLKLNYEAIEKIAHRGPDNQGLFEDDDVVLGHTRLSIQDISENGHQPFFSPDGNVILVYNGEIYNHREIRESLNLPKENYRSTSDTETIMQGYLEKGDQIFSQLNGIFALALYDRIKGVLLITRDRFGVKPLYYSLTNKSLQFSSELKSLQPESNELNENGLANYVRFLWSPGEETPYQSVKKLIPATVLSINVSDVTDVKEDRFFKPGFNGKRTDTSEDEAVDKLEELLLRAVERQLLSDVPVGFFLSGGVDSSLLVAMACKVLKGKRLQCFTIDTEEFARKEGFSNDLDYAKIAAKYLGVDLEIVNSGIDIVGDFDKMIWHLDEPQADAAPLHVLNISQKAKEMGYKVLIGGAGGDDVFSGYRRHQILKYEKMLKKVPSPLLSLLGFLGDKLRPSTPNLRRAKKLMSRMKYSNTERLFSLFTWLPEATVKGIFSKPFQKALLSKDPFHYFKDKLNEIPDEKDLLNQMLHLEMTTFLIDHNFNYTDKMGMAAGVEIRVPFLDNDVVDFSYGIPTEYKLKNNTTKYILKKVAERYLPKEIIYRSKAGFGAPVRKWITQDLQPLIDERLTKESVDIQGVFNYEALQKLIRENKLGKVDASYSIWAVLAIDSWIKQFLNKGNSKN